MKEFMLKVRDYLKTTISLSEKKLDKNKEYLEMVEQILKEKFQWVDTEENYSATAGYGEKKEE